MKNHALTYLLVGTALLFSALRVATAEDSAQQQPPTYRHYAVKTGTDLKLTTPGLPAKEKYKFIAALIPVEVVGVIAESAPNVRAFYNSKSQRIEFVTRFGDIVASFPRLGASDIAKYFAKREIAKGNRDVLLNVKSAGTFFTGLVARAKSKQFPLEDLLFNRTDRLSYVAAWTVTSDKKKRDNRVRPLADRFIFPVHGEQAYGSII